MNKPTAYIHTMECYIAAKKEHTTYVYSIHEYLKYCAKEKISDLKNKGYIILLKQNSKKPLVINILDFKFMVT